MILFQYHQFETFRAKYRYVYIYDPARNVQNLVRFPHFTHITLLLEKLWNCNKMSYYCIHIDDCHCHGIV